MVLVDVPFDDNDSAQYYYGECDSLLADCCTKTRLTAPLHFRTMNRRRRQMAFEILRQMKLQHQPAGVLAVRAKRRNQKKCFYKKLCCTGKHGRRRRRRTLLASSQITFSFPMRDLLFFFHR